jgi:hypothetical protein
VVNIVDVRNVVVPIRSDISNAFIDFSSMTVSVVAVVTDVSLLRSLKCEAHRTAALAPHHSVLRIGRARVVGGGQPVRVGLGVGRGG